MDGNAKAVPVQRVVRRTLPEKVEGAEMTCKSCGSDLVCHMSKYEGGFENKQQWQNSDGSAHYKWKSAGKYDCVLSEENNETSEQAENQASSTTPKNKTPTFSQETISMIEGETLTLYMIRNAVNEFLKKFEDSPHGGMVGQFTELIFEKHFKATFKKASEIKNE